MIINGRDTTKYNSNGTSKKDLSYYKSLPTQKASTTQEKMDNLWVESTAPNTLQKQNINTTVKPLNISAFVKDVKDAADQKKLKVEEDIEKAGYKSSDFTEDQKKQLISGQYYINPSYNPDNKFSQKLIYSGKTSDIKATPSLGQSVANVAEKTGRTTMDLIGNVATGITQGMEGYVDAAVGVGGTALSGLANLAGQKELSQNIKNKAEQIAGYGFAKNMQNLVDEKSQQGAGIYNPSILGTVDVRDAAKEIARMYAVAATGGLPGLMVSATGGNIEEALNEGESLGRATAYGAITGSLEGIAEKMFDPAKILGGGLKTIGKGFLGKVAEATVGEGAEEGITAALNPFIKMLTYEGDVENPFGSWDNFKNYLRDIGQSVYQGAIIGGLTLGVSAPGNVDLQNSFRDDVHKAVEKIKGVNQARKDEIANTIIEGATQTENIEGLPKNEAQNQAQNQETNPANTITPNQVKMVQNANMEQIAQTPNLPTQKAQETLQSAKIAGMTDMDIQKAKELNDMLRSGTRLKFYDPQNIPQGVDVSRAADANGFYMDGTLWINKNSEMKVERILGHELTHHIENDDLINTILDSNIFYDFLSEKGFSNTAEFKKYLKEKKGYKQEELTSEMVAHFAEEKMFGKEETINRLARENRTLAQKILNWLSDLKTKIAGSTEAKELLKIENMYRKALEQARSQQATTTNQVAYSQNVLDDGTIYVKTSDNNFRKPDGTKMTPREAYNSLVGTRIEFGNGESALIIKRLPGNKDLYNELFKRHPSKFKNIEDIKKLNNDVNYNIQELLSTSEIKKSNEADFENRHKEQGITSFDTRTVNFYDGENAYLIEFSIATLQSGEKIAYAKKSFEGSKELTQKIKAAEAKSEKSLLNQQPLSNNSINQNDSSVNTQYAQENKNDTAGKEPAFSMPKTDNQGRTLSKEQQEFFKDSKVRDEDNNLKVMYHSTNSDFNTFDIGKSNEGIYGKGFYFTENKSFSKNYGNRLIEAYLNLKTPLYANYNTEQITFNDTNIKEFLEEVYRKEKVDLNKYGKWATLDNFANRLNGDGDWSIISQISQTFRIKPTNLIKISNDLGITNYDGIIAKDETVVLNPNQIKNVDNPNPTSNPDIRYSMNPVEVAKNPPNIETGLDQLKRTSRVKEGDTQSNFTKNIYNQSIFDDKFKDLALDDKNIRSYASISNKETLQEANDAINEQGQKWVDRFLDKPNGEMKATDIAGGFILMNRYQQAGDYESMIRVAEKLRKAGTQQGQTIQMFSILGRMTPEGMTYYAQKELNKAYDEILKNKTQKWADEHADEFKLNDRDIEYIQRRVNQAARLPEGRDKYILLAEIAERIQNKIPPQPGQGLKALARNSMLLNPKTMVRNVLGNVVIAPAHVASDFVGAKIDKAISKKTGVRTTGGFQVKSLQGVKKGVYESFDDFRRQISTREMGGDRFEIGQGKNFYENHTGRFGETRNKINKALNGLDRVTGFLLETGDRPFYETWFINSLNNQMKLNNVTEPTAEMIEIATDEALQRTWQDNNTYTKFVNSIRKGMNNLNVKGYGLGDIVMPFVKTPANLTKAVVDFSPLGAINAAIKTSQFNKDIGKGTATAKQQREVVKAWSQVITGTLGMAIATGLANAGILGGGSDEDKDVRSFEQNVLGIKPYSIKIGDKTYTYDWAQPLGTSAAMVADTVKSLKNAKDTEGKVAAILEGVQSGASVLLDQSFVSGIRNLFEEDNLINALIEAGFNEGAKFTPQFLSQLAQLQDDTARTSYVYNNIPQTAINKVKAKIPGLRETLEPSVDVLGREVKTDNSVGNVMFNPTNTATARTTEGAEEMYRVYKATGEKSAIAQVAPYYFNVGSEKVVLTPKQRTQYQKTIGKIASDGVENLIDNKAYKNLPDTDKAKILAELYSYGNAVAKEEASKKYLMPKDMQKIKDSGMTPEEYILAKHIANSGGAKKEELYHALTSAGYSAKQTKKFLNYYKGYKF